MPDAIDAPELRKAVSAALQEHAMEVDGERSVLVGFGLVIEWLAPDGERWLSLAGGDASGGPGTEWQLQGYFHNALHADWPSPHEDDD